MSGPVSITDASPAVADCSHPSAPCVEVSDSRDEQVGKIRVRGALPRKGRRTVGAWCFADHWAPPTSLRTAASTSGLTRTSACRR